jgi:hypothetical protein
MKNKHNENEKIFWRKWNRLWLIILPIWVVTLISVWVLIEEFIHTNLSWDQNLTAQPSIQIQDLKYTPASGAEDH